MSEYYDGEFIRKRIIQLKGQKRVSDREISLSIGKGEAYICNILTGKHLPKMDMFFAICEYFGITPLEFFDNEIEYPAISKEINNELKRLLGDDYCHFPAFLKSLSVNDVNALKKIHNKAKHSEHEKTPAP